jgi:hypothetical protein
MIRIVRRFLNLLFTVGIYNKHYKMTYTGDVTSANYIWEGGHWGKRNTVKERYSQIFSVMMREAQFAPINEMSLIVFYNTKHDVDNIQAICKIFVDTMKGVYIPDDNNKLYKSIHVAHDPDLPKKTVEFHVIGR